MFNAGDNLGAYFLSESTLKNEQITSPSLGWLLPSKLFWKDTEVLVQSEKQNYTLSNLQQYFMYDHLDSYYFYCVSSLFPFSSANIFASQRYRCS